MNLECMDLRKARCFVLKDSDDSIRNLHVSNGPTLVIDCPPYTMYFIMSSARETKVNKKTHEKRFFFGQFRIKMTFCYFLYHVDFDD